MRSLQLRWFVLLLLALLPAFVASGWAIGQAYQNEQALLDNRLRNATRTLSSVVEQELARRADLARALAQAQVLDAGVGMSAQSLAIFAMQARRALGPVASWVELHSPQGLLLSTREARAGASRPLRKILPMVDRPSVLALNDGGDGVGLRAAVVHPVQRGGRTVLNIVVSVLPAELQTLVDQQTWPAHSVAAILDGQGVPMARHPGGASPVGQGAMSDLKARIGPQAEGRFESVLPDGMSAIGYHATAPHGWTYLTALPRDHHVRAVLQALGPLLLGFGLLLALALGGSLWAVRSIAAPVSSLTRLAARLRAGEVPEVRPSGIAEIDQVASALRDTATQLQSARAHLESQLQDAAVRTRVAEQRISQSLRAQALVRLTGGVAHDFNNMLGVIGNSAQLMERLDSTGTMAAPLAATLRAVDLGRRLTQNLVRFAGRQRVHAQPLAVCPYLNDTQELMQTVLGKRVQLIMHCAHEVSCVAVDASELEVALINLALNARDAMPQGGQVRIQARLADAIETADLPPGPYVRLAMSDTGPGIDPDLLTRLLNPSFTSGPEGKGAGLGQVRDFCQQAGGSAAIFSRPGEGTTVAMLLPAVAQPAALDVFPATQAVANANRSLTGLRLLLVEDIPDLAETTERLLKACGFEVVRALSAEQALQCADQGEAFDVVLSDVVMPGEMDGLAMARRLRQRHPGLPIVLISGYDTAVVDAFDFTVLYKPCAPGELLGALQQAIDQASPVEASGHAGFEPLLGTLH